METGLQEVIGRLDQQQELLPRMTRVASALPARSARPISRC
jgi:hypothetical protein